MTADQVVAVSGADETEDKEDKGKDKDGEREEEEVDADLDMDVIVVEEDEGGDEAIARGIDEMGEGEEEDGRKQEKEAESEAESESEAVAVRTSPALPRDNREYGRKEYWEERFANEADFEWLVSYGDVSDLISDVYVQRGDRILVVGCGNSSFSSDLYDAGYVDVTSIDYSTTVIAAMRRKNETTRPGMVWMVMDMTDMSAFPDESFDVVVDKAAMDALMTNEGDVWHPDDAVVDKARDMCRHVSRLLRKGGYHIHISFAQPHFRRKYLLGLHRGSGDGHGQEGVPKDSGEGMEEKGQAEEEEDDDDDDDEDDNRPPIAEGSGYSQEFGWDLKVETIAGDSKDGCFHHFLYIMKKLR